MWKKCKIIMLPTEENAPIFKIGNWNKLYDSTEILSTNPADFAQDESYQHLYILSDEEIKEGDWYVDDTNQIRQNFTSDKEYWNKKLNYKKITATTDSSLTFDDAFNSWILPQLSQSFISLYIELYNKGNAPVDVEVEYDIEWVDAGGFECTCGYITTGIGGTGPCPYCGGWRFTEIKEPKYHLKTDSNNCISIKRSKESWTKKELKEIVLRFHFHFTLSKDNIPGTNVGIWFDKWIEQNL